MIEHAIKVAKRSSTGKYAMGCVITSNNKIVSNGWAHVPNIKNWRLYSLHAELHALIRMRDQILESATAYIAAVSRKSGNTTLARPCRDCALALFSAGINDVIYTVPGGTEQISLFYQLDHLDSFKVYNSPQY